MQFGDCALIIHNFDQTCVFHEICHVVCYQPLECNRINEIAFECQLALLLGLAEHSQYDPTLERFVSSQFMISHLDEN